MKLAYRRLGIDIGTVVLTVALLVLLSLALIGCVPDTDTDLPQITAPDGMHVTTKKILMTLLAMFATSKQAETRVLPFRKPRRRSA